MNALFSALTTVTVIRVWGQNESTIGIALPPASLMRARTIGQIATLIMEHMGSPTAAPAAPVKEVVPDDAVDIDALSDAEIERLLGEAPETPSDEVLVEKGN